MKYIKFLFITTIALGIYNLNSFEVPQEIASATMTDVLPESIPVSQEVPTTQETTESEKNTLKDWTDFLETLTKDNWDDNLHVPLAAWQEKALNLAKAIVTQDTSLKKTIQKTLLDKITTITKSLLDSLSFITQFNETIDAIAPANAVESLSEESNITTPAKGAQQPVTEQNQSTPQEITEPPLPVVAPPAPQQETFPEVSGTIASEVQQNQSPTTQEETDIKTQWQNQLQKLKTEGTDWATTDPILKEIYEVSKKILSSLKPKELQEQLGALQRQFANALRDRRYESNLHPLNPEQELVKFNDQLNPILAQHQEQFMPQQDLFMQSSQVSMAVVDEILKKSKQQEDKVHKLEKDLEQQKIIAEKERIERELKEKERKEKEEQRKKDLLTARAGIAYQQGHFPSQQAAKIGSLAKDERKKKDKELKDLKKQIAENAKLIAEKEKAEKEKGWLQIGRDWLYGSKDQELIAALKSKQQEVLGLLAKSDPYDKQQLERFYNTLIQFNTEEFWKKNSLNNPRWIKDLRQQSEAIIKTNILELEDILSIIKRTWIAFNKIPPKEVGPLVESLLQPLIDAEKQKKEEQEQAKQRIQQQVALKQEKEQQRLLVLRQKKDEELNKRMEQQKLLTANSTYKDEKKYWYNLLDQIAHAKKITPDLHKQYAQKALEKSQRLLQLASYIPKKNKQKISQKLKQKFAVSLLEQQKDTDEPLNIYHTMDWFNNELNKLAD